MEHFLSAEDGHIIFEHSSTSGHASETLSLKVDDRDSDAEDDVDRVHVELLLSTSPAASENATISLADDFSPPMTTSHGCVGWNKRRDCYHWDATSGEGSMAWNFAKGTSDGMVIGPFEPDALSSCIRVSFPRLEGLSVVRLISHGTSEGVSHVEVRSLSVC